MNQLTTTRGNMVAASLEIDGRADVAAGAVYFQNELTYQNGQPYSEAAKAHAALLADLQTYIEAHGVDAAIDYLRPQR
jgi:hypothetical protein